jgi:hypothetical protein
MGNLECCTTRETAGDAPAAIKIRGKGDNVLGKDSAYLTSLYITLVLTPPIVKRDKDEFKTFLLCLKFAYFLKVKVELRRYALNKENLLTLDNAKKDRLANNKMEFVSNLLKSLPKYKDGGCPFTDKRKQNFKGMVNLPNGEKYQGTWVTNDDGTEVIHGKGVYVYENGSQFVGWFFQGQIVGKGRLILHNGDVYEGSFEDQKYSGEGKYIFGDTHAVIGHYEGEFKNNKMTGKGKFDVQSKRPLTKLFGKVAIH